METINYTLKLEKEMFERVEREAKKLHINLEEAFRTTIARGLPTASSSFGLEEVAADTWEKLGPAPDIDYDKL